MCKVFFYDFLCVKDNGVVLDTCSNMHILRVCRSRQRVRVTGDDYVGVYVSGQSWQQLTVVDTHFSVIVINTTLYFMYLDSLGSS